MEPVRYWAERKVSLMELTRVSRSLELDHSSFSNVNPIGGSQEVDIAGSGLFRGCGGGVGG